MTPGPARRLAPRAAPPPPSTAARADAPRPRAAPLWRWPLCALWACALWACGQPPQPSPPQAWLTFEPAASGTATPSAGALWAHPHEGRSFACADCHRLDARQGLRGAPALLRPHPGALPRFAQAIARCELRYQRRAPHLAAHAQTIAQHLPIALDAPQGHDEPQALWRSTCAHCHSTPRAPDLCGRPWPAHRLIAAVRGHNQPAHPDRQMPRLSEAQISDPALAALAQRFEREPGSVCVQRPPFVLGSESSQGGVP